MKRALLFSALLLAACGKPENDGDLKAAFAASALKDPSSVQLRNVKANDEIICGEYNSKNSYGAYNGFEPFVFERSIKDLWLGDGENTYSHSAFWKQCPNAAQLGLNDGVTDMNATTMDMNATDLNTAVEADPAISAANQALDDARNSVANAQAATRDDADEETQPSYDVNNDAGE